MAPPKQRKVAIVGSRAVGKSSMTVQFVDGHFVDSYYPTIENTFSKMIKYKNQEYATEIIDTAGQVPEVFFSPRVAKPSPAQPSSTPHYHDACVRKWLTRVLFPRMNIVFLIRSTLSVSTATLLYTRLPASRASKWLASFAIRFSTISLSNGSLSLSSATNPTSVPNNVKSRPKTVALLPMSSNARGRKLAHATTRMYKRLSSS